MFLLVFSFVFVIVIVCLLEGPRGFCTCQNIVSAFFLVLWHRFVVRNLCLFLIWAFVPGPLCLVFELGFSLSLGISRFGRRFGLVCFEFIFIFIKRG